MLGRKFNRGTSPSPLSVPITIEAKHFDQNGKAIPADFKVGSLPEDNGYYQNLISVGSNAAFQQEILTQLFFVHRDVLMIPRNATEHQRSVALAEIQGRAWTLRRMLDMPFTAERILYERRARENR